MNYHLQHYFPSFFFGGGGAVDVLHLFSVLEKSKMKCSTPKPEVKRVVRRPPFLYSLPFVQFCFQFSYFTARLFLRFLNFFLRGWGRLFCSFSLKTWSLWGDPGNFVCFRMGHTFGRLGHLIILWCFLDNHDHFYNKDDDNNVNGGQGVIFGLNKKFS